MINRLRKKSGKQHPSQYPQITSNSLVITLTNQVKDLYAKNVKSLKKEIEEAVRRWKDLPCLWVGRINTVTVGILPKASYRFNAVPIETPTQFFTDLERTILNVIWKNKKTQDS